MKFTTTFDTDIACKVGVEEAIMLQWATERCEYVAAQGRQEDIIDGEVWAQFPMCYVDGVFPFLSISQKLRVCMKLEKAKLMKHKFDRSAQMFSLSVPAKAGAKAKAKKTEKPVKTAEDVRDFYLTNLETGQQEVMSMTTGSIVNMMIDKFKTVNPDYEIFYSRKVQRDVLVRMIEKYSIDSLFYLLSVLPQTNSMQFAPTITSPVEFSRLAPKLIAFIQKKRSENDSTFKMNV